MARKETDLFGAEELEKAFKKMKDKYESVSAAYLAAEARVIKRAVAAATPKSDKKHKGGRDRHLKQTWRDKKPKEYKNGTVLVSMIESQASHAHLYELGHRLILRRGRKRDESGRYLKTGKRLGKTAGKRNTLGALLRARNGGFVPGHPVLADTMEAARSRWGKNAEKAFDDILKEFEK